MVTRAIALVLVVVGLTACGSGKNAATLAADQKKADKLAIERARTRCVLMRSISNHAA